MACSRCSTGLQCIYCGGVDHPGLLGCSIKVFPEQLTREMIMKYDISREGTIQQGDPVPNVQLFRATNSEVVNLTDLLLENGPTVLCFEAHPSDGWHLFNLGEEHCILTAKTTQDRQQAALKLSQVHDIPLNSLFIDTMENNAEKEFAAWPERIFIIENSKIVYKGGMGPDHYHPEDIQDWIEKKNQPN